MAQMMKDENDCVDTDVFLFIVGSGAALSSALPLLFRFL